MQSYAGEIEWLKAKVSENPASMFYSRLADRYLQIHNIEQAMECAEKSVLLHPHDATARYVLAKCCYTHNDFEKADKHLHEALLAEPNHLAALSLQCELLRNSGDVAGVEENYSRIIDLDPFDDTIHQKIYNLKHETSMLEEDQSLKSISRDSDMPKTEAELLYPNTTEDLETELEPQDRETLLAQDPFADFGDKAPAHTEEAWHDKKQLLDDQHTLEYEGKAETKIVESTETSYREEDVLDESIDDNFEIDRSKFKEEESKFTKLLDDIFSSSLEEEEQVEKRQQSTLKRMGADKDASEYAGEESDTVFEPLLPRERDLTPEEKILQNDRRQHDDSFDYRGEIDAMIDESDLSEEIIAPEDEDKFTDDHVAQDTLPPPRPDRKDFANFIKSLDIKEDSKEAEKKRDSYDDSLLGIEDDFAIPDDLDDSLPPLSIDDDWMQKFPREEDSTSHGAFADEQSHFDSRTNYFKSKSEEKPAGSNEKKESESSKGKFFTPTLGEIYAAQGQYAKAISVFETLIKNDPENDWYVSKLEYLKKKLAEQKH